MNKNRIRHLLFWHGINLPVFDISSPKARQEISRLCFCEETRRSIEQCQWIINSLKEAIRDLDKQLSELSSGIDEVELLRTIPGIGSMRAATIYAEIGEINRFKNSKGLADYTGLIPSLRASGNTVHSGGITKVGSRPLRHALVEA